MYLLQKVSCTLPAHVSGTATVTVTSRGITYDSLSLLYSDDATPQVTSISPTKGKSGDTITITGDKLNSTAGSTPTVKVRIHPKYVFNFIFLE